MSTTEDKQRRAEDVDSPELYSDLAIEREVSKVCFTTTSYCDEDTLSAFTCENFRAEAYGRLEGLYWVYGNLEHILMHPQGELDGKDAFAFLFLPLGILLISTCIPIPSIIRNRNFSSTLSATSSR